MNSNWHNKNNNKKVEKWKEDKSWCKFLFGWILFLMVSWIKLVSSMWSPMIRPHPSQFMRKKIKWKVLQRMNRLHPKAQCLSKGIWSSISQEDMDDHSTLRKLQRISYKCIVIGPSSTIPRSGGEFPEIHSNSPHQDYTYPTMVMELNK